jgi:hypothetical protein
MILPGAPTTPSHPAQHSRLVRRCRSTRFPARQRFASPRTAQSRCPAQHQRRRAGRDAPNHRATRHCKKSEPIAARHCKKSEPTATRHCKKSEPRATRHCCKKSERDAPPQASPRTWRSRHQSPRPAAQLPPLQDEYATEPCKSLNNTAHKHPHPYSHPPICAALCTHPCVDHGNEKRVSTKAATGRG